MQQPMMQPGMPGQTIYYPGSTTRVFVVKNSMPHVKPHCHKCNNTHINYKKGRPCKYCVCSKCGGDGVIEEKGNKICKKMKLKD